jgi:CDP-diacylglycerol---serine O-phosphatidyltransferase
MRRRRVKAKSNRPPKRGFYILPNLMTTASLFCGFYGLVAAIQHDFQRAALAVLASFFFDGLDGRIARATRTTSQFGVEYDSLSDLVAFGVAPAVLALTWGLADAGRLGWLAAFLFTACGALRLARFNTLVQKGPVGHFKGLPIPAAAGLVVTMVLFCAEVGWEQGPPREVLLVTLYALSFLMVSNIPYQSFKNLESVRQRPFQALVACVLLLVVVLIHPPVTLFLLSLAYAISGPLGLLGRLRKRTPASQDSVHEHQQEETP